MTDAAFKKKKNTQTGSDERISTHPSYTEYSWDAVMNGKDGTFTSNTGTVSTVKNMDGAAVRSAHGVKSNTASGAVHRGRRPLDGYEKAPRRTASAPTKTGARAAGKAETAKPVEKAAEKVRRKRVVKTHTIAVERKYSFPLSIVLISLCFTLLIMSIVTTSVQISEITIENSALKRQYNTLVSDENELLLRLETRDDLRTVERIATEELGMVKKDQVDRYYLTVHREDRIEIVEEAEEQRGGIFDGVMSFGGSVVERIRGFFGQ